MEPYRPFSPGEATAFERSASVLMPATPESHQTGTGNDQR